MKIIVLESIPLLLRAISELIETHADSPYCLDVLQNAVDEILEVQPDVAWLDASLPEVQDGSIVKTIHKKFPELKILLFGPEPSVPEVRKYFKLGISAYLPKTADAEEIEAALECLKGGKNYVPTTISKSFTNWLTDPVHKIKPGGKLTHREQEVLQLIVEEFTTYEIAQKLYICKCTVETHRNNLILKLGVKNTAGLVREAIQRQLC
jgi:DNA-binding NarL/FixJ family response regulator